VLNRLHNEHFAVFPGLAEIHKLAEVVFGLLRINGRATYLPVIIAIQPYGRGSGQSDKHLSKYLPIIRDSPVYPIIYDSVDQVLSMPPIINSEHSKITLNTRNVFIDVTATDETKLNIVVNIVASMFSEYCETPYT